MDFFERQDKARRNTKVLVVYFTLAVIALVLAVYFVVALIFTGAGTKGGGAGPGWWNPQLFAGSAVLTLAVIGIGSLTKTLQLSRGGSAVASMLGGRLVNSNTTDPDERKLLNVVEEMALASGVPVPQVYVMDHEDSINAFAAGRTTSDAVIGVTRGCIRLLNRDELQGVMAHEFSHILNGDMRLNLRLMGIIFGIVCLAVVGRVLLHARSRGSRDRNPLPLLGLALLLIGWIGVFFGRLIQAAVSRQREFLADAAAVQFTRNPDGIAGALKKIGGLSYGSKVSAAHAEEASHMFFGNGMGQSFSGLMATHPPLVQRIKAIDPGFDGKFPRVSPPETRTQPLPPGAKPQPRRAGFPFPGAPRQGAGVAGLAPPIIAAQLLPQMGNPSTAHLRYAAELRDSFPPAVQEAEHEPLGAMAIVFGLLLSADDATRAKQLELLAQNTSPAVHQETVRLLPHVRSVARHGRLPLVDLALPALRELSPAQYQQFSTALRLVIESDSEIDLFEYVLQKIVMRHLEPHFAQPRREIVQYYSLKPLAGDCSVLLSALAHVGHTNPVEVEAAFRHGAQPLSQAAQAQLALLPGKESDLRQLDAALNRLAHASPQIKKSVLNACAQTVAADNVIQETEAELLRGIADTLDCPMPPFVQPK